MASGVSSSSMLSCCQRRFWGCRIETADVTCNTTECHIMVDYGFVAIILCCGLIADNILTKMKLSKLQERVDKIQATND